MCQSRCPLRLYRVARERREMPTRAGTLPIGASNWRIPPFVISDLDQEFREGPLEGTMKEIEAAFRSTEQRRTQHDTERLSRRRTSGF